MIEVLLSSALICFGGECHPILAGKDTPLGEFDIEHRLTKQKGYGGDILLFADRPNGWFAIHRTWPGRERLYANASVYRRHISHGCINVQPEVYDKLVALKAGTLVVKP